MDFVMPGRVMKKEEEKEGRGGEETNESVRGENKKKKWRHILAKREIEGGGGNKDT